VRYQMRSMRVEDVPQANEIDRECFPTQWPPPSYKRDLLSSRPTHYLVAYEEGASPEMEHAEERGSGLRWLLKKVQHPFHNDGASTSNQKIVGVIGLWIMADEAHITTIGVRQAYRRQGIGELLLLSAIDLALMRKARLVTLEVRASNTAAQALYEKYGFTKVGVRRGYYSDNREDALIMSTDTITSASFQSRFQRLKRAVAERWGLAQSQIGG